MPWIKFIGDYDWKMNPQVLTAYKTGMRCLVSQACAQAAIDAGKAVDDVKPQELKSRRYIRRGADAGSQSA